jgi:hypothetical protein
VPSHPSIGRMQKRLPTRMPSISNACASGPAESTVSSNWREMFDRVRWARNAAAVFKEATRAYDVVLTRAQFYAMGLRD